MKTKLVCWTGTNGVHYELSAPEHCDWMAWDEDGELCWYSQDPEIEHDYWYGGHVKVGYGIAPPEPGPWTDQLYWIGD